MRTRWIFTGVAAGIACGSLLVAAVRTEREPARSPDHVVASATPIAAAPATPDVSAPVRVTTAPPRAPASPAPVSAATAAMVVAVDPVSGRLGMPESQGRGPLTVDELQALARAEAEGLVTVRHADGSESIAHEGRFAHHALLVIGRDGKPSFRCAHGAHGMSVALDRTHSAGAALEEE